MLRIIPIKGLKQLKSELKMNLKKPPLKYLKQMYSSFDRKYKKNIKRLIIVHPTSWMKTVWMFLKPFISAKFGQKVTYINHLRKMFLQKGFILVNRVRCVLMVVVPLLPRVDFGPYNNWEDASHFIWKIT